MGDELGVRNDKRLHQFESSGYICEGIYKPEQSSSLYFIDGHNLIPCPTLMALSPDLSSLISQYIAVHELWSIGSAILHHLNISCSLKTTLYFLVIHLLHLYSAFLFEAQGGLHYQQQQQQKPPMLLGLRASR